MSMMLMVQAMACQVGNSARKLVLLKLADNANDDGLCWPSYQYIADCCEMGKRSTIDHINALQEMGLVLVEKRQNNNGDNYSNVYKLTLCAPPSANSAPPGANSAPRTSQVTTHTHNARVHTREKTLIPDDFEIDEVVSARLFSSGMTIPCAEFLIDDFVNKNISTGYCSFDWAAEFASYCKRYAWRFEKHEESKQANNGLSRAEQSAANYLERLQNA